MVLLGRSTGATPRSSIEGEFHITGKLTPAADSNHFVPGLHRGILTLDTNALIVAASY